MFKWGLLIWGVCFGALTANAAPTRTIDATTTEGFYSVENLVKNAGFETGSASPKSWTASGGTLAITTTASQVARGNQAASWDSSAAAQTLTDDLVSIPSGLKGRNGLLSCSALCASGTCTHQLILWDGTNEVAAQTITSSAATHQRTTFNFIFPTSGSLAVRLKSVASNEPALYLDDCVIGSADGVNLAQVSQAKFIGSAYFATTAGCLPTNTGATLDAIGTDTDCPGPTVELNPGPGVIQTTDADALVVTVNALPPGNCSVTFTGKNVTNTNNDQTTVAISDGTSVSGHSYGAQDTVNQNAGFTSIGKFQYLTPGNRTFTLFSAASLGTLTFKNAADLERTRFSIECYPLTSELAHRPELSNWYVDANISGANISLGVSNQSAYITPNNSGLTLVQNSGSQAVGVSCSSTNDNSVGATTCPAGSEEPGVVVNIPVAGAYEVCFDFGHSVETDTTAGVTNVAFQVARTANGSQTIAEEGKSRVSSGNENAGVVAVRDIKPVRSCGIFNVPSAAKHTFRLMYEQAVTSASVNQIFADADTSNGQRDVHVTVKPWLQNQAAVNYVGSVTSVSTGQVRHESVYISAINPGGDSCTVDERTGDWINGNGTVPGATNGKCAFTFNAGVFSAAPACTLTIVGGGATPYGGAVNVIPTSSGITTQIFNTNSGAGSNEAFFMHCTGPR